MRSPTLIVTVAVSAVAIGACGGGDADVDAAGGDDAPAADARIDAAPIDTPEIPTACAAGRELGDRPDDSSLDQVRLLYVVPSDGADQELDISGQICNSTRAFATWFHDQTGSYVRLDTVDGELDIGFVRLALTDQQMRGSDPNNTSIDTGTAFVRERIERELVRMGMIAPNKLYGVYYGGTSSWACGGGAYPPLIIARVGAMYLRAMPGGLAVACADVRPWGQASLVPNYIDYGMMHEIVHTAGFVSMPAPHQHTTGHVYDPGVADPSRDLMYSPRPGMPDPPWNIDDGLLVDLGGDDYWRAPGLLDLAKSSLLSPLPADAERPIGW